jgi:hypothetical protein
MDALHEEGRNVAEQIRIVYDFKFQDGTSKKFDIHLDRENLLLRNELQQELPAWTRLEFKQCSNCPLDIDRHVYCPVAANLPGLVQEFKGVTSKDNVDVTVVVKERTYSKTTSIKEGLSPLLGVIMATSGCPVMEPLKPMARYHLPFASLDETAYRTLAMFLVAQLIREHAGKKPEWGAEGLAKIYGEVKVLNKDFGQRMIEAARNDANVHALVNLNVFALMVPLAAEKMLKEMAPYFSAYLK